jgi:translation initiation factor 2 subunit 2
MDYDEQLDRAIAETPDIAEGSDRFEVPDPEVRPEGNVTVYENFQTTLDRLDRSEEHVTKFLQTDLGTSASIDEKGRVRLTGDFRARRVADALESYVDSFVRCQECGLPDTQVVTEQGTRVLKCDACGALSPVPDL